MTRFGILRAQRRHTYRDLFACSHISLSTPRPASASVSIRQHPLASVSIRQHTPQARQKRNSSAYVSIRQHTLQARPKQNSSLYSTWKSLPDRFVMLSVVKISADVGWMPTRLSRSAFVAFSFSAIPKPWITSPALIIKINS
jgi:hypothetical protein